uniref:Uncharacterized protein n=1 Tax=Romanomermis culicivorax TaxID=13658 RepID=A0A915HIS3_ROMCU
MLRAVNDDVSIIEASPFQTATTPWSPKIGVLCEVHPCGAWSSTSPVRSQYRPTMMKNKATQRAHTVNIGLYLQTPLPPSWAPSIASSRRSTSGTQTSSRWASRHLMAKSHRSVDKWQLHALPHKSTGISNFTRHQPH